MDLQQPADLQTLLRTFVETETEIGYWQKRTQAVLLFLEDRLLTINEQCRQIPEGDAHARERSRCALTDILKTYQELLTTMKDRIQQLDTMKQDLTRKLSQYS